MHYLFILRLTNFAIYLPNDSLQLERCIGVTRSSVVWRSHVLTVAKDKSFIPTQEIAISALRCHLSIFTSPTGLNGKISALV